MQKKMFRVIGVLAISILPIVLAACGEDEAVVRQRELYESYALADLQGFVNSGEAAKALDALHYYRDEGIASDGHMLLMAKIYVGLEAGVAAEETIVKLLARGFEESKTALIHAQSLVLQGKHSAAEQVLDGKNLPDSDAFDALVLRGDIMYSIGEYASAEGFYQSAIKAAPENFLGYTAAALFYVQRGNYDRAKQFSDKAYVRETENHMVNYTQGMVARYRGEIDKAVNFFLQSIDMQQSNLLARLELVGIYLAQDKFEEAQQQLDTIYGYVPNNPMANYYTSLMLVRDGKLDEAEDLLLRTGDFTRAYPLAAQVYGMTTYELGKHAAAIPFLRRSLNSIPNHVPTRLALADSMLKTGKASGALEILRPLADAGTNITALIYATSAAAATGDMRTARGYIEAALELAENDSESDAESVNALKKRAAFARFLDNDLESATALLDEMQPDGSVNVDNLVSKANMLLSSGKLEQAGVVLNQLLLAEPDSAAVINLKGALLHRQRKYKQAIEAYSAAIAKVPQYESALKNRAFTYLVMEEFSNAKADLDILSELSSQDPQVAAMYGRALLETGDAEAAIPFLKRAIEALPNSAIIVADYAEATAALGHYTSAINIARGAKFIGAPSTGFLAYLNEKISEWQSAKAEIEKAEQKDRDARTVRVSEQQAEEKEQREAFLEEVGDTALPNDDQGALDELKKIAAENRKLRKTEELEAMAAVLERSKLSADQENTSNLADAAIRISRNELFGAWLASELGLDGQQSIDYIHSVVLADDSEAGDTDLIRKALQDLEAAGKFFTVQSIEATLAEKMIEALSAQAAMDGSPKG